MLYIFATAGSTGLIVGCFAAAVADVFPAYRKILQDCGGGLIVGGVVLLGIAFPMI